MCVYSEKTATHKYGTRRLLYYAIELSTGGVNCSPWQASWNCFVFHVAPSTCTLVQPDRLSFNCEHSPPITMAQQTLLLLAALGSAAYASTSASASSSADATSTMTVLLPMLDSQTAVMGSIMGVDATATSYYLTCPTGESSLTCGLGDGIELVEGASMLEVHFTEDSIG